MKRVTGLGGVFFKSKDPAASRAWYREHLGIATEDYGFSFLWRDLEKPEERGYTVWSPFARETEYFAPSDQPFMVNLRVADLDGLLAALEKEGIQRVGEVLTEGNGRFAWVLDPDGVKIELWEPVPSAKDPYLPSEG